MRDFEFPLRLLGYDAPELNEGGEEAKAWLEDEILGQEVNVLIDSENRVGKYGRLLGHVVYQGLDVGQSMFYLGYVKEFDQRNEGEISDLGMWINPSQWF